MDDRYMNYFTDKLNFVNCQVELELSHKVDWNRGIYFYLMSLFKWMIMNLE